MIGKETFERYTPVALAVLRIVTALIFLEHGSQKLFGFPAAQPSGLPPALSFFWFGGILEFFGGLLVLVGLFTRCAAFVLAGKWRSPIGWFTRPRASFRH